MSRICFLWLSVFISALLMQVKGEEGVGIQRIEGELRVGLTTPVGSFHSGKAKLSACLGVEMRYNFKTMPLDCGLMLELSTARRSYTHLYDHGNDLWQSNRTLAFGIPVDYNFCRGTKISPFVGAVVGIASNDVVGDKYFPGDYTSFYFAPRAGVELFHHLRLMGQLNLSRKGYNNFSFTIGACIGGRPK